MPSCIISNKIALFLMRKNTLRICLLLNKVMKITCLFTGHRIDATTNKHYSWHLHAFPFSFPFSLSLLSLLFYWLGPNTFTNISWFNKFATERTGNFAKNPWEKCSWLQCKRQGNYLLPVAACHAFNAVVPPAMPPSLYVPHTRLFTFTSILIFFLFLLFFYICKFLTRSHPVALLPRPHIKYFGLLREFVSEGGSGCCC